MKKGMNRKAQGTSVTFIIALVIGVLVLVFAFYMMYKTPSVESGKVNVGSIVQSCQISCSTSTSGYYDYCTRTRSVVFDETGKKNARNNQPYTCRQLETEGVGLERCDALTCDVQYYKCTDLIQTNCAGIAGCGGDFVTPDQVKSYQDQVGLAPLKYKEVKILTVSDPVDKATGKVCLKWVDN
ncbi:MAG: hypothetical protein WC979_05200 [Candidatus Pacearchaeota archaeon]|jgi:hypothetical protein